MAFTTERVAVGHTELFVLRGGSGRPLVVLHGVEGHEGRVVATEHALVFRGRAHLYEGHGVAPVVHGVRTAVLAGCRTVVLTNAAGSLDPRGGPNLEHLALLTRWHTSTWRDGEWIEIEWPAKIPYRKLVNAIARVAHAAAPSAP